MKIVYDDIFVDFGVFVDTIMYGFINDLTLTKSLKPSLVIGEEKEGLSEFLNFQKKSIFFKYTSTRPQTVHGINSVLWAVVEKHYS